MMEYEECDEDRYDCTTDPEYMENYIKKTDINIQYQLHAEKMQEMTRAITERKISVRASRIYPVLVNALWRDENGKLFCLSFHDVAIILYEAFEGKKPVNQEDYKEYHKMVSEPGDIDETVVDKIEKELDWKLLGFM